MYIRHSPLKITLTHTLCGWLRGKRGKNRAWRTGNERSNERRNKKRARPVFFARCAERLLHNIVCTLCIHKNARIHTILYDHGLSGIVCRMDLLLIMHLIGYGRIFLLVSKLAPQWKIERERATHLFRSARTNCKRRKMWFWCSRRSFRYRNRILHNFWCD